jgi:organic hydroperoxide reductase OsmC/OhrA
MSNSSVSISLRQQQDFQFDINFGEALPVLRADEPAPLGKGEGPVPGQLLAAAVGNCLAASLLFAMRKFKQQPEPISAEVSCEVGRTDKGRMRITRIMARLNLGVEAGLLQNLDRILESFEDFCTVSQSVRQGIPIDVEVFDASGRKLK